MDKSYVIAIPSYKRQETLKKRTLALLQHYKIPSNKIYIFVATPEEKKLYQEHLDSNTYRELVVGKPGIQNIRNFMPKIDGFIHLRPKKSLILKSNQPDW